MAMARIALTFNDDPKIIQAGGFELGTAELLRVVDELSQAWQEKIGLTFFCVGQNLKQMQLQSPQLLEQMSQGGHEIANQSFTQPKNFHQLPIPEVLAEVGKTHDLIEQLFGRSPRFFRPPGGLISPEAERAIRQKFPGYRIVGWDRHDEKGNDTPATLQARIVTHAHDQQVTLLHAWRQPTLWGLRGTLTQLRQQGYRFVPLGDLDRIPRYGLRDCSPPKFNQPRIALTFDDDPKVLSSPNGVRLGTPELLRVIEELNQTATLPIRVTFFVVGVNLAKAIRQYPDVVERMKAGGHEIQNHSYSHPSNFHQLSVQDAVDEVRRNHDLITETFDREPRYFRPPKGLLSPSNHRAILEAFPSYQICGWDRHDEKDGYHPNQLKEAVVGSAWDGQIALLHVWYQTTLWAMRGIFQDLQAKNYQFVTISDVGRDPTLYGIKDQDIAVV